MGEGAVKRSKVLVQHGERKRKEDEEKDRQAGIVGFWAGWLACLR